MIYKEPTFILLSIGSNIGDRKKYLNDAYKALCDNKVLINSKISSFYETEPCGYKDQDWFVNAAISGWTSLSLFSLIDTCKTIEYFLGRKKNEKWHEREIDIDVLIYGNEISNNINITVPHPLMQERKFVLIPAAEIAGKVIHPLLNKTIDELLSNCADSSRVNRID